MINLQHLYHSISELESAFQSIRKDQPCLMQIFTSCLAPAQAVDLAKDVQKMFPLAHVIGTSVSGVIYRGDQYDNHTLITAEQYEKACLCSCMVSFEQKSFQDIAEELAHTWDQQKPTLLRLYMGSYYDYAHQFIHAMNALVPEVKITGGMSGEVHQSKIIPFVFDTNHALANALICAGVTGDHLSIYQRINTSHEPISSVYTITKTHDCAIDTIENEPARDWLQRNIGFLSTKQYESWEDIANNDPLVRFQLVLEDHPATSRFLRFDEPTQQISQYFSRLDAGTKFRISYSSPAKCVEECKQTSLEVQSTPMQQLFCYNCVFRKLYLKNCAQWELTPYHQNPVSGVFLLGEFGHNGIANELCNGSCVLCGIGEEEHYLTVDFSSLEQLEIVHAENEGLMDFIIKKRKITKTKENDTILADVFNRENAHYIDPKLNMFNALQYEKEKVPMRFNKLCLIKIENADILLSYMGQDAYFKQLHSRTDWLTSIQQKDLIKKLLHVYVSSFDTFIIATNDSMDQEVFIHQMRELEKLFDQKQELSGAAPFLTRFMLVFNDEFLLERAYTLMRNNSKTQTRFVVGQIDDEQNTATKKELECISTIQYALLNDKVIPYYQGIYNNQTQKIDKYEALMRLQDREGNILTPGYFMEVSKKYRMYLDLNLKMLHNVARDFSKINVPVSINLSAHDISSAKYRLALFDILKSFHTPSNLIIELLEDEYFSDMDALKEFINEVRTFGVKVAIDDFGSGYSNLLEIVKIRPDYFKIDGTIIKGLSKDFESETILEAISVIAQNLSINMVAESVENEVIQDIVEKFGILHSQGYHFSMPQPFSEVYLNETTHQTS